MSPKDETFARALADGKKAADAYQEAGFTGGAANARRKKASPTIKERVAELLAQREQAVAQATGAMAARIVLTREWVIDVLVENIRQAKADGDLAAVNKSAELLGKDIGMFVERSVNVNVNADLNRLSDAELIDLLESEGVSFDLTASPGSPQLN